MKHAVFLHGTNGDPGDHWWPWLRGKFENSGYEVWAPKLPGCDRPNKRTYHDFLVGQDWDFRSNVLVGHSSGATTVLNLLADDSFPKVQVAILVASFLNEDLTKTVDWYENGQFDELFPVGGFEFEKLRIKADKFYFVHSQDDPYCSYEDALRACKLLGGEMITIPNGGHLSKSFGIVELPQLVQTLRRDDVL